MAISVVIVSLLAGVVMWMIVMGARHWTSDAERRKRVLELSDPAEINEVLAEQLHLHDASARSSGDYPQEHRDQKRTPPAPRERARAGFSQRTTYSRG